MYFLIIIQFPISSMAPEPIQPSMMVVTPVLWELDSEIACEVRNCVPSRGCPPGSTYVPARFLHSVIEWVYATSPLGHPGIFATLSVDYVKEDFGDFRQHDLAITHNRKVRLSACYRGSVDSSGLTVAEVWQHDWAGFLVWAEFAQNSLRHSATGLMLFQCVYVLSQELIDEFHASWPDRPASHPRDAPILPIFEPTFHEHSPSPYVCVSPTLVCYAASFSFIITHICFPFCISYFRVTSTHSPR